MINLRKWSTVVLFLFPMFVLGQSSTSTPNVGLKIPAYGSLDDQLIFGYDLNQLDLFLSGNSATTPTTWKSTTTYSSGQAVLFLGKLYVSLTGANTGNVPSTSPSSWTTALTNTPGAAILNQTILQAFQGPVSSPAVNSVLNPATFSGSDLGQQIIAAGTFCSNLCTVDVPSGTYALNSNATAPAGVRLKFEQGAVVTIASGVAWTVKSVLEAGRYPIFAGTGTVSLATNRSLREIYPEWWGADPTGTTDSTSAWQAALTAAQNINGLAGVISCSQATYNISNTLSYLAANTAQGVSISGPEGQVNGAPSACTLNWTGVAGGTLLHTIGGHTQRISGVNFTGTGLARPVWFDSTNAATAASSAISSITRSGNVVTVTTAAAEPWVAGTDITISGVTNTSFDMVGMPVWYALSSTQFVFSQSGPNATSSGGTAALVVSGDTEQPNLSYGSLYVSPQAGVSVSSCSIASNLLSCTLSSPEIMYPNQWARITGSSDPVYNAYWKVQTVTSATTFTALAAEVTSEAATTSGTFYGPSAAFSIGSNALALLNNSNAELSVDHILVRGVASSGNYPLAGFEDDGFGNTKNFAFTNSNVLNVRIGYLNFSSGTFLSQNNSGSLILDAIYALPITDTVTIENEEEEGSGAYFVANLVSGSNQAATLGTNGQFEVAQYADTSTGTLTLIGNDLSVLSYASDGVAIATTANLNMSGNEFGEVSNTTAIPLIMVSTNSNPNTRQAVFSSGNTFANVTNGWIPILINGSSVTPPSPGITSLGDMYTDSTLHTHPLTNIFAQGTGKDYLTDLNGILQFNSGRVAVGDSAGNLNMPGTISNSTGALGVVQNLVKYSQFDSASIGSAWLSLSGGAAPASVTPDTTAVTDPSGGNTAEAFVAPSTFGAYTISGQSQAVTLTSGQTYTMGACFRGAAGGEAIEYGLSTYPYDAALTLTTSWQCVSLTKTTSGSVTPGFFWATSTPSATIYVAFAQLAQAPSLGFYVHTTSAAISLTGLYTNNVNDQSLTPVTPVCTDASSNLSTTNCPTSGGTTISSSSDVVVTNFTAEQLLCSLEVPANTLSGTQDGPNSRMKFHAAVTTGPGTGNMTVALNLSTSNTFAGVSRLDGPTASGSFGRSYIIDGQCHMRGSSSIICDASISNSTNLLVTQVLAGTAFSVGSPIYWIISGTQTVATDTTTCREMQVQIY